MRLNYYEKTHCNRNNTGIICWNYTVHRIFGMYCAAVRRIQSLGTVIKHSFVGNIFSTILFNVQFKKGENTIVNSKCGLP